MENVDKDLKELEDALLTPLFMKKGLTDADMESLYKVGYDLYGAGAYAKAEAVFRGLVTLDALNEKYHMALAGALEAQEKWEKATEHYGIVCSAINVRNTKASLRAAECFDRLGWTSKAAMAREHARFYGKEVAK